MAKAPAAKVTATGEKYPKIELRGILDPWADVSEKNKVRILSGDGGVTGLVPPGLQFGYTQDYTPPFATILSQFNTGFVAIQELMNKGQASDYSLVLQEMKTQVWGGGSDINFSLPLFYVARAGAQVDVVNPIRRLVAMSAPQAAGRATLEFLEKQVTGTSVAPPPAVSIEIGNVISLTRAIIGSVTVQLPTNVVDSRGQPNEALVTLQVKSHKMFLSNDSEVKFLGGILNTGGGAEL